MKLIEMYYYLFYKYYKFFESFETTRWLTDWKAAFLVISVEIWILFSLDFYYDILSRRRGTLEFLSFKVLIPFVILLLIKWFAFWKDERWKHYVHEFDQWPEEKNRKGSWIVAGVTLFFFANLLVSLRLDPPPGGWK